MKGLYEAGMKSITGESQKPGWSCKRCGGNKFNRTRGGRKCVSCPGEDYYGRCVQ